MAEIDSPGALYAALSQLALRAAVEQLDAELEQRNVLDGDLPLLDRAIASARASGMSGAAVAAVEHILDPLRRLAGAATGRTAAATQMADAAEAAVSVAVKHVGLQGAGAGGRFYQQAGPAAR